MTQPEEILTYWFGELTSDAEIPEDRSALWWAKDSATDYFIRQVYEPVVSAAARGDLDHWKAEARSSLAWIVLQDQFCRNMYRGTPAAFERDLPCQIQCLEGIDLGFDQELRPLERVFYYLPLEHSEDLEVQQRSVELFAALAEAAPTEVRKAFDGYLGFAQKHLDVIERFGRFPHRNGILGRESTEEEREYLAQPGAGF